MKGKNSLVVGTAVIAFILTGCAGTYNKSETGIGLGALTGGALAYGLAKDSSKKELWTVLGIGLGAMVGQDIGAKLDDRDRMLAGQALEQIKSLHLPILFRHSTLIFSLIRRR